jgi:CO dehydrogenase maturation factor
MRICICGKGGSGKSIVVSLFAAGFRRSGKDVVILDSDESNANLFWMLGLDRSPRPLMDLVGGKKAVQQRMIARFTAGEDEPAMTLWEMEKLPIHEIPPEYVAQGKDCKLIVTGKIHQSLEGCACPMGAVTREFHQRVSQEAPTGTESDSRGGHGGRNRAFRRGLEANVDMVLCVAEPSLESISLARRVMELTEQSGAFFKGAVLNKISSPEQQDIVTRKLEELGVSVIGAIGYDSEIQESCLEGHALDAPAAAVVASVIAGELLQDAGSPEE